MRQFRAVQIRSSNDLFQRRRSVEKMCVVQFVVESLPTFLSISVATIRPKTRSRSEPSGTRR